MEWVNRYVGIPYLDGGRTRTGCDCYGLIRLVLAEQFHINLDAHDQFYTHATRDRRIIAERIQATKSRWPWRGVAREPALGDVLLFTIKALPIHCALALGPSEMLHIQAGTDAVVENWRKSLSWKPRLDGVYQHGHVG